MLHCTEIGEDWLLSCGAPARNFAGLAVQSEMERRGNRRGDWGLFIGTTSTRIVKGVMRIEEGE
jgi:hypothetical protein